ncbi:MAG: hypothetical protein IT437_04760 [Phycisphaerales bacterium]|nr:hypothetical protein [Phycisphaerales bacterium]
MKRAVLTILVSVIAGCSGGGTTLVPPPPEPEAGRPVVRGAQDGLEMWWWVVSGEHAPVTPLLVPYLDRPVPLPDADIQRLRRGGLRVVSVPLDDLAGLQARLPTIGAVQHQWLGQVPAWTDVVSGPPRPDRTTVDVGDGLLALEPGRLRMLLRCWVVPDPDTEGTAWPAGAVHIELAPQHVPDARHARPTLSAKHAVPAPEDQGLVLGRFAASFTMKGGHAILLVPESAAADWTTPVAPATPDQPRNGPVGPQVAAPPTIGEALLAGRVDEKSGRRTRAIIVLIARAPERFELTGIAP